MCNALYMPLMFSMCHDNGHLYARFHRFPCWIHSSIGFHLSSIWVLIFSQTPARSQELRCTPPVHSITRRTRCSWNLRACPNMSRLVKRSAACWLGIFFTYIAVSCCFQYRYSKDSNFQFSKDKLLGTDTDWLL